MGKNQNSLQNQVNLLLSSKKNSKQLKNCKKRIILKNVDIRILRSKGQSTVHKSAKIPKTNFFVVIHGYHQSQVISIKRHIHQHFTFALPFEIVEKMLVLSLYWFAAQQETSTFLLTIQCRIEILLLASKKKQEVAQKLHKPNITQKTQIYVLHGLRVNPSRPNP